MSSAELLAIAYLLVTRGRTLVRPRSGDSPWLYPIDFYTTIMRQTIVGRVEERNPTNDPILKIIGRLFCISGQPWIEQNLCLNDQHSSDFVPLSDLHAYVLIQNF